MKKKILALISSLALITGFVFAPLALAGSPVNVIDGSGDACKGSTSICGTNGNSLFRIVKNIINVLLYASGIIAVLMIIIGGISYVLSGGDQSKITTAKNTILYAVVGLIVAIMAFAIVNFVLERIF